jgi:hypothetical protein
MMMIPRSAMAMPSDKMRPSVVLSNWPQTGLGGLLAAGVG